MLGKSCQMDTLPLPCMRKTECNVDNSLLFPNNFKLLKTFANIVFNPNSLDFNPMIHLPNICLKLPPALGQYFLVLQKPIVGGV